MRRSQPKAERGFGVAAAISMASIGAVAIAFAAGAAATGYESSVSARRDRIQAELDRAACADSIVLVRAKDPFASGDVDLGELGCSVRL